MQIPILQGLTLADRAVHRGRWKKFLVTDGEPAESNNVTETCPANHMPAAAPACDAAPSSGACSFNTTWMGI